MDLNDVERVDFNALGGADTIVVNDLTGTDVTEINLNLGGLGGAGDGAAGRGDRPRHERRRRGPGRWRRPACPCSGWRHGEHHRAEAANDRLTVKALAGDDVVEAAGLAAGAIQLTADGGDGRRRAGRRRRRRRAPRRAGDDVLVGGPGRTSSTAAPATTS